MKTVPATEQPPNPHENPAAFTIGYLWREKSMEWRKKAACAGEDPELFFPYSRGDGSRKQANAAKAICHKCPVMADCLDWAMNAYPMPYGIWGGTDETERAQLRRKN